MKPNKEALSSASDRETFEDRFARCRHLLHFVAVRILGSQDEGEDAVGNCQAIASRNPPSFESEGAFRSWVVRIVIDEAIALLHQKESGFFFTESDKSLAASAEGSTGRRVCRPINAHTRS